MAENYKGEKITISFDGDVCIHSRNCVLGLPKVFQANVSGPWIKPDNASVEDLIAVAKSCGSPRRRTGTQDPGDFVPLRGVLEKTLLRRQPQGSRIHSQR